MLRDRVFLSFHWHVWCLQEERQRLVSSSRFPKSGSWLVSCLLLCPIYIPWAGLAFLIVLSAVCSQSGKSQEKDLMVPVPRGCREWSCAARGELGSLLLQFLPTTPTVASGPTFLILLIPALASLIPFWVPFKPHCNPDLGSVWSAGTSQAVDRSHSPWHRCGLRDTRTAIPPDGHQDGPKGCGEQQEGEEHWESSGESSQGSREACMH